MSKRSEHLKKKSEVDRVASDTGIGQTKIGGRAISPGRLICN
jgi:hypothetical protein